MFHSTRDFLIIQMELNNIPKNTKNNKTSLQKGNTRAMGKYMFYGMWRAKAGFISYLIWVAISCKS